MDVPHVGASPELERADPTWKMMSALWEDGPRGCTRGHSKSSWEEAPWNSDAHPSCTPSLHLHGLLCSHLVHLEGTAGPS